MTDFRDRIPKIQALVDALGADYSHIHAVLRGGTRPGPTLALRIEEATAGTIQRWELRPDLWEPPQQLVAGGQSAPSDGVGSGLLVEQVHDVTGLVHAEHEPQDHPAHVPASKTEAA